MQLVWAATPVYLLEGAIDGKNGVVTPLPWTCYDGESVHLMGYTNYPALKKMVNDSDYIPYKTIINDQEFGLLDITIIKYLNTTTGPYNEVVVSTPVQKNKLRLVEGCSLDDITCMFRESVTYDLIQWFVIEMWLDEPLPVATGIQIVSVNKALADTIDINVTTSNGAKSWSVRFKDEATNADMNMTLTETEVTMADLAYNSFIFLQSTLPKLDDLGSPGDPDNIIDMLQTLISPMMNPEHHNSLVMPKGVYPKNFGTSINPVVEATLEAKGGEHAKLFDDMETTFAIGGGLAVLEFQPIAAWFMSGLTGHLMPPTNEPEFVKNVNERIIQLGSEGPSLVEAYSMGDIG